MINECDNKLEEEALEFKVRESIINIINKENISLDNKLIKILNVIKYFK